ncbi:hypothetical protein C8F01DRAFT_1111505 [Mycena amicta]|nr:hypothetical protein C8F01DRAFT_1160298 [Mycena amicta]KAJ7071696.1 hypothetical protein C8F01DRAFT_1111505 [Mycena amicta]
MAGTEQSERHDILEVSTAKAHIRITVDFSSWLRRLVHLHLIASIVQSWGPNALALFFFPRRTCTVRGNIRSSPCNGHWPSTVEVLVSRTIRSIARKRPSRLAQAHYLRARCPGPTTQIAQTRPSRLARKPTNDHPSSACHPFGRRHRSVILLRGLPLSANGAVVCMCAIDVTIVPELGFVGMDHVSVGSVPHRELVLSLRLQRSPHARAIRSDPARSSVVRLASSLVGVHRPILRA